MLTLVPVWATLGICLEHPVGLSRAWCRSGTRPSSGSAPIRSTLAFVLLGHHALDSACRSPASSAGSSGLGSSAIRPSGLRGHYFALSMLAYPLALLYVFEWLGLQEVSLPMQAASPRRPSCSSATPRIYSLMALGLMIAALLICLTGRAVALRHVAAGHQAERDRLPRPRASTPSAGSCKAIAVSGTIAGTIGGFYVMVLLLWSRRKRCSAWLTQSPGPDHGPVRRRRLGRGARSSVPPSSIPLTEVLHAELGDKLPGIQGVVYGLAIIATILFAQQGVYWRLRDYFRSRRGAERVGSLAEALRPRRPRAGVPLPVGKGAGKAPADAEPMLQLSGVSRRFGGLLALNEVALNVHRGTILRRHRPERRGQDHAVQHDQRLPRSQRRLYPLGSGRCVGLRPDQLCKLGIGRTFQIVRPFARMSVLENIIIGSYVNTTSDAEAEARAWEAIHRVGLTEGGPMWPPAT